jgi:hypothetical protein
VHAFTRCCIAGYDLPLSQLQQFRQWGSATPGHPEFGHTVGVEATTGPLGQGVGNSVGMALSAKMLAARFNDGDFRPITHRIFTLASDGDLEEGVSGEASSLAGHLKSTTSSSSTTTAGCEARPISRFRGRRPAIRRLRLRRAFGGHVTTIARASMPRWPGPAISIVFLLTVRSAPHKHDTAKRTARRRFGEIRARKRRPATAIDRRSRAD